MEATARELLSQCAWCGKEIPDDTEVFAINAKANPKIDLTGQQGTVIPLPLHATRTIIPGIVVTDDSPAKRAGYDLVFMICSEECDDSLREALTAEVELYQSEPEDDDGAGE